MGTYAQPGWRPWGGGWQPQTEGTGGTNLLQGPCLAA